MLKNDFWAKYFKVYDILNLCIPYQELKEEFVLALEPKRGEKILDAGGGTGNVAIELLKEGADVTVLDFSKEALDMCKKKNKKINTTHGNLTEKLPFPNHFFDKVVSSNALYTISPQKRIFVIKEIFRVLKPEGIFVLSNIKTGFKPIEIYKNHIKESINRSGVPKTLKTIIKMTWPTIKMFHYNKLIKKEHSEGGYEFLTPEEQEKLLLNNGFKLLGEPKIVYGGQAVLSISKK